MNTLDMTELKPGDRIEMDLPSDSIKRVAVVIHVDYETDSAWCRWDDKMTRHLNFVINSGSGWRYEQESDFQRAIRAAFKAGYLRACWEEGRLSGQRVFDIDEYVRSVTPE